MIFNPFVVWELVSLLISFPFSVMTTFDAFVMHGFFVGLGVAAGNFIALWFLEYLRKHKGIDLSPFRMTLNFPLQLAEPTPTPMSVTIVRKMQKKTSKGTGIKPKPFKRKPLTAAQRRQRSLIAKRQKRKGGRFT